MAVWTFADAYQTTLSAGISAAATSFAPTSTTGNPGADPTLPTPTQFACILQSAGYPGSGTREIVTVTDTRTGTWTCTATANAYLTSDIVAAVVSATSIGGVLRASPQRLMLPSGAVTASFDRSGIQVTGTGMVSGNLLMAGVPLVAGDVVSAFNMRVTSSSSGGTHCWAGFFDVNRVCRAISADDTTAVALTTGTTKTLTFASPYTIPSTGMYYAGICVVATTPGFVAASSNTNANATGLAPFTAGTLASQTTPPTVGNTMGALTSTGFVPYMWLT